MKRVRKWGVYLIRQKVEQFYFFGWTWSLHVMYQPPNIWILRRSKKYVFSDDCKTSIIKQIYYRTKTLFLYRIKTCVTYFQPNNNSNYTWTNSIVYYATRKVSLNWQFFTVTACPKQQTPWNKKSTFALKFRTRIPVGEEQVLALKFRTSSPVREEQVLAGFLNSELGDAV